MSSGSSFSFLTPKNLNDVRKAVQLVDVLKRSNQVVPPQLASAAATLERRGGGQQLRRGNRNQFSDRNRWDDGNRERDNYTRGNRFGREQNNTEAGRYGGRPNQSVDNRRGQTGGLKGKSIDFGDFGEFGDVKSNVPLRLDNVVGKWRDSDRSGYSRDNNRERSGSFTDKRKNGNFGNNFSDNVVEKSSNRTEWGSDEAIEDSHRLKARRSFARKNQW